MKSTGTILLIMFALVTMVSGQAHFTSVDTTGLPYIIVINDVVLDNVIGNECEIGVFDDTLCVGAAHYDGINNVQVTAWEGSESLGLPGFVPGNPIIYMIWVKANDIFQEFDCTSEYEKGNGTFGYGSYSAVTLRCESVLRVSSFHQENQCRINCYPNPFNSSSRIEYMFSTCSPYSIEIYDIKGTKVFRHFVKNTNKEKYIFNWNGRSDSGSELPSGIYMVSIFSADFQATSKITYLK